MLKMRLARHGRRKRPFYAWWWAESSKPRDGRFQEILGQYDPLVEDATLDGERGACLLLAVEGRAAVGHGASAARPARLDGAAGREAAEQEGGREAGCYRGGRCRRGGKRRLTHAGTRGVHRQVGGG